MSDFDSRAEPQTDAEFQALDNEYADEDLRRAAASARTEDEYLEALRSAGSLGAGMAIVGTRPSLRQIARECEAMDDAELDEYIAQCCRSHVRYRRAGNLDAASICLSCVMTADDVREQRLANRKEIA